MARLGDAARVRRGAASARRAATPRDLAAAVATAAARAADVLGVGARRRRAKSTTPVPGRMQRRRRRARAARAPRSRAASRRRSPRTPLARPAALELLESRRAREASVAMISLPQRSCGDSALLAVLVQLARALDAQLRLQRAGRVVETGVDRRPSCGRSGARRLAARARARTPMRPALRAISSRATASPTMPPPTTARSQRSARGAPGPATAPIYPHDGAGAARRGRGGRVYQSGAVQAFVAAAAQFASRWRAGARRSASGVGWRPITPLAMISAAVADTCGVGHRGAFIARRQAEASGRAAREGDLEDVASGRQFGTAVGVAGEVGVGAAAGGHERQAGAVV